MPIHDTAGLALPVTKSAANSGITQNINAVRGLACLLVVALHVVGDADSNGLHLPMTSHWHYVMMSIEFLRIPLFTAMSGYLYAGRRVTREEFARFWSKKARRLGIPLVFATVVIWLIRGHAYAESTTLPNALLYSFGHLWYIQALILLFALVSVLDAFFQFSFTALVLAGLAAVMLSQSGIPAISFFSLSGAIYLTPYFLFGIILREQPALLRDRRAGSLSLGIVVIVLASQQLGLHDLINPVTLLELPAAIAGMAGVVFMLQRLPNNALLGTIGGYSYTIYLWHIVPSATVRVALIKAGVANISILFVCSFIAALTVPIIIYQVARRIPLLSMAFTGERWVPGLTAASASLIQNRRLSPIR